MRSFIVSLLFILGLGLVTAGCNNKDRDAVTTPSPPVYIDAQTIPNADVGDSYSYYVKASGGTQPYAWTISQGSLPSGLYLDPSRGEISGLPTAAGKVNFSIRVTDVRGQVSSYATAIIVTNVQ
jgi:hypothetical protein